MKIWTTVLLIILSGQVIAAKDKRLNCINKDDFGSWLADFKREALGQGISRKIVNRAFSGVSPDQKVISFDRRQGVFSQSFLKFSDRMVNNYRMVHGKRRMKKYAHVFKRIEKRFGVPPSVITAFWALETDFGANTGNFPTIKALATLAWDCRRPELFRPQLMAALEILERGDQTVSSMRGAWAGEVGQMQFLPSEYVDKGIDFDQDGVVDLIKSTPDALASTANAISQLGWLPGQAWLVEVDIPDQMDWQESGIDKALPVSDWMARGVNAANQSQLPNQDLKASLLLLMGRNGPAFLAYPNFKKVYLKWNNSLVYSTTAAYLATRLDGASPVGRGKATVKPLNLAQTKRLQRALVTLGFDVGGVDGIVGTKTRAAVRAMQLYFKLPADAYPDIKLLGKVEQLARDPSMRKAFSSASRVLAPSAIPFILDQKQRITIAYEH